MFKGHSPFPKVAVMGVRIAMQRQSIQYAIQLYYRLYTVTIYKVDQHTMAYILRLKT